MILYILMEEDEPQGIFDSLEKAQNCGQEIASARPLWEQIDGREYYLDRNSVGGRRPLWIRGFPLNGGL